MGRDVSGRRGGFMKPFLAGFFDVGWLDTRTGIGSGAQYEVEKGSMDRGWGSI
jgi:hypothetical protein